MNEAETRAELIDPALRELGWVTEDNVKVSRELLKEIRKLIK